MIMDLPFPILAFLAGMMSVISPCVLPILPAIFAYSIEGNKYRPVTIVIGLSISFTILGVITSAAGHAIQAYIDYLQLLSGVIILIMGLLLLFDLPLNTGGIGNKVSSFIDRIQLKGLIGGLLFGSALGVVWIPCIGPFLATILAIVAVEGNIITGGILLFIYSLGLGVPILVIAYLPRHSKKIVRRMTHMGVAIRRVAGAILTVTGIYFIFSVMRFIF
jgi:cytochrome c-type biogenesis protein